MMNGLQPGDELVLSGGTYVLSGRFSISLGGTAGMPIAQNEVAHFHRPNVNQNVVDVDYAEHATLRGVELSGGSAGIRISGATMFTIEDCEVHDTGDVAIRANDSGVTYRALRILRNHIHHTNNTGEGMYLGCNNAGCEVVDSLIEGNYIHDTNQDSVTQGDGIELKEGSGGNVIRDNVIHDTNYPCILTYASNGTPNVIERNVMWGCGDHGIQSAADAVIRNNIILGAGSDGIAMQPHQSGSPAELLVVHNTVLNAGGDAMSLRGISGSVVVANNALYASGGRAFFANGTDGLVFEGNVGSGGGTVPLDDGDVERDFVDANFSGSLPIDVFPDSAGALPSSGANAYVATDDFNGTARDGVADVGAYAAADRNPGWTLQRDFKALASTSEPVSGGSGGDEPPAVGTGGSGGSSDATGAPLVNHTGGGCSSAGRPNRSPAAYGLFVLAAAACLRRRPRVTPR